MIPVGQQRTYRRKEQQRLVERKLPTVQVNAGVELAVSVLDLVQDGRQRAALRLRQPAVGTEREPDVGPVAVEIDAAAIPDVVGTIAGEDTIFIAVHDAKAQRLTVKQIWELFGD